MPDMARYLQLGKCNLALLVQVLLMRSFDHWEDRRMVTFAADVLAVMAMQARTAIGEAAPQLQQQQFWQQQQ